MLMAILSFQTVRGEDGFLVENIQVKGLQRISAGTVYNYLPVTVGEKFSSVIAFFLLIIASALSFFPLVTGVFGWGYLSIIVPDFLFVSAGIISFRDISLAQRMIKTGMLLSIGSFLIGGV